MAHNLVRENVSVNAAVDAECALANTGYLRIKTVGGLQLAELRFGGSAFNGAVAGVATAKAITPDTDADNNGAAAKYEVYGSDGATLLWTGTVGVTGGGFDMEIPNVNIVQHSEVIVSSFTHTAPKHP